MNDIFSQTVNKLGRYFVLFFEKVIYSISKPLPPNLFSDWSEYKSLLEDNHIDFSKFHQHILDFYKLSVHDCPNLESLELKYTNYIYINDYLPENRDRAHSEISSNEMKIPLHLTYEKIVKEQSPKKIVFSPTSKKSKEEKLKINMLPNPFLIIPEKNNAGIVVKHLFGEEYGDNCSPILNKFSKNEIGLQSKFGKLNSFKMDGVWNEKKDELKQKIDETLILFQKNSALLEIINEKSIDVQTPVNEISENFKDFEHHKNFEDVVLFKRKSFFSKNDLAFKEIVKIVDNTNEKKMIFN